MKSALIFLAVCGGIVLVGWVVSRLTGARTRYLDDWKFGDGESTLWRDDGADVYLISKYGQARVMSFMRRRRSTVLVTTQRILVATQPLFGRKRMVQYLLSPSPPPDGQSEKLDGGLLTIGYQSIVIQPGAVTAQLDGKKPYLELLPASGHASSTNLETIRIYTDNGAGFRLP